MTVYVLQQWIKPRTITDEGVWYWDLTSIFKTIHEAQTERAEFFRDDRLTRIVAMEMTESEVIDDERPVLQQELFA